MTGLAALLLTSPGVLTHPGGLFLAGGGRTPGELADRFVAECGAGGLIVVLPLASAEPEVGGEGSAGFLREHGAKRVTVWAKAAPTDEDRKGLDEILKTARGIWMAGGDQRRIVARLGLDWARGHIAPRVEAGMNVYGTSAGAMVVSRTMITGNGKADGTAETAPGLGLTGWVVDTHFAQRGREARLRDALKTTGLTRGIGVDERSWVLLRGDAILERHGGVTVIEP